MSLILTGLSQKEIIKDNAPSLENQEKIMDDYIMLLDISKCDNKDKKKEEAIKYKIHIKQCIKHTKLMSEWAIKTYEFERLCGSSQEEIVAGNYASRRFSIYTQYLPPYEPNKNSIKK